MNAPEYASDRDVPGGYYAPWERDEEPDDEETADEQPAETGETIPHDWRAHLGDDEAPF